MIKKKTKKIEVKAFAYINKKDRTLVDFAMPVKSFEEFYKRTKATFENKRLHEIIDIKHKVVPVTITYSYKVK